MRILYYALMLLLLAGCTGSSGGTTSQGDTGGSDMGTPATGDTGSMDAVEDVSVEIKGYSYNPASITVNKGDTVTWTNMDGPSHTVTGSGFDSGSLGNGESFSHTFNEAGTYSYGCSFHPSMHGTVVVE